MSWLIKIIPGCIAAIWTTALRKDWKTDRGKIKFFARLFFYGIGIHAVILGGLYVIGMRNFSLDEMSVSFKVKYLGLGMVFALYVPFAIHNFVKLKKEQYGEIWKLFLPVNLFLTVTYAVFIPSSLVVGNMGEFRTGYAMLIPILASAAVLMMGALYLLELSLSHDSVKNLLYAIVFATALGIYVQSNFMNPEFPLMDGAEFDWSIYNGYLIVSTSVWIVIFAGSIFAAIRLREHTIKLIKYAAFFLTLVQAASLVPTVCMNPSDGSEDYVYTLDGEFELGTEKNIVLFVVDTLQSEALRTYLDSDSYVKGSLDDFTFYSEGVSGAAPTEYAIPLLLSGLEYDPQQSFGTYTSQIWSDSGFLEMLYTDGYDIRLYTEMNMTPNIPEKWVSNYAKRHVEHEKYYFKFGKEIFNLTNLNVAPQAIKKSLWMSTEQIVKYIRMLYSGYRLDDVELYDNWCENGTKVDTPYDKAFRMIHMQGAHAPYLMDENCNAVEECDSSEEKVIHGSFQFITEYIEAMKQSGVYEQSTIVILGDHGRHEDGNLETNAAILVKEPYEKYTLKESDSPVHFRNVVATMAQNDREDTSDYGPALKDITKDSDVDRLHTVTRWVCDRAFAGTGISYDRSVRFVVAGKANSCEDCLEWKPKEVNRVEYQLGNVIRFGEADHDRNKNQVDFGVRVKSDSIQLKNEFSMCLSMEEAVKQDAILQMHVSKVWGEYQRCLVYVNGNRAGILEFVKSDADYTLDIPKENLNDSELVIRMVFPGAVTPRMLDENTKDDSVVSIELESMMVK